MAKGITVTDTELNEVDNNINNEPSNNEITQNVNNSDSDNTPSNYNLVQDKNIGGNANSISITIADTKTPIIVLFGPTNSGKTMALIRLSRYLNTKDYNVLPIKTFRDSFDNTYCELCDNFNTFINSQNAANGTKLIDFMLISITKNAGNPICQILEAPGEHYYDRTTPNAQFPTYFNVIKNCNNRKIWLIMVEPSWFNQNDRFGYVNKIKQLKTNMKPQDKVLFLYNKVDKTNFVRTPGVVNTAAMLKSMKNEYPGILEPFENKNPIMKIFKKYNCDVVPFSNGDFNEIEDNNLTYTPSVEEYPRLLWSKIMKLIKG
ncbi:MAG: hypothetical protein R3Y59_03655 [bacterium]